VIRRARSDDAAVLAELNARALWAAYDGYVEHHKIAAVVPRLAEGWRQALGTEAESDRETWVLERDGVLAGWVTVGPSRDANARDGDGELRAVYVAPERVGRGDGHALLVQGEARLAALGHPAATLWVFTENATARRFYERHGWARDHRPGTNPWGDWGDCVRYRKALTGVPSE
jgi:GNAT superfamily N-acetyltransferase